MLTRLPGWKEAFLRFWGTGRVLFENSDEMSGPRENSREKFRITSHGNFMATLNPVHPEQMPRLCCDPA